MIEIDGSYGEGGGQILRTALALSAITKNPCCIFNIRKNRENPGLGVQHLVFVRAIKEIFNAKLEGDEIGSKEIIFEPNEIFKNEIEINIETAGSITLILQALLLPILLSGKEFKIKFKGGATDTFFSPTIDYFRFVFLENIKNLISQVSKEKEFLKINIIKRGFYPKGNSQVEVKTLPTSVLKKVGEFNLIERGKLKKILIISGASASLKEKKVAERQISGVHQTPIFYKKVHLPIETKIEYYDSFSNGSQITIVGEFERSLIGASSLGKIGKSSEEVGREAGMSFLKEVKEEAVVDSHFADQILPYVSLFALKAEIKSSFITEHTKTNAWVIEKFLDGKFEFDKNFIKWYSKKEIK